MSLPAARARQPVSDEHPAVRAARLAPIDDEPETPEEAALVAKARAETETIPHEVVREHWLGRR